MSQTSKVRDAVRIAIIEAVSKSETGLVTDELSLATGMNPKSTREVALKLTREGTLKREKKHSHLLNRVAWHYRVPESMRSLPVPVPKPEPLALAAIAG